MELIKLDGFTRIYSLSTFERQYRKLFGKSEGSYQQYQQKLRTNLRILDLEGRTALSYQQFEPLQNSRLYAIRHVSELNPRVIFAYVGEDETVLLLSCALEKDVSDYRRAMEKAEQALKQLEENL